MQRRPGATTIDHAHDGSVNPLISSKPLWVAAFTGLRTRSGEARPTRVDVLDATRRAVATLNADAMFRTASRWHPLVAALTVEQREVLVPQR